MRKKLSVTKKKAVSRKTTSRSTKGTKFNKGALGAGTAYAVLGMSVLLFAAAMMLGSVVPNKQPTSGQSVIILSTTPGDRHSNLQLFTFPGVTITLTPTPTTPPQPQQSNGSGSGSHYGGGNSGGNGGGNGGSHSPSGGGGNGGNSGGGGNSGASSNGAM